MTTKIPFAGLLLLALSACAHAPPYPARMIENDAEHLSNVVITEENLASIVLVGRAGVERVAGSNQLKVMVPIRNIGGEPIELLVQVSFLDGRQSPIGDDTNQRLLMLGPGSTQPVTVLSRTDVAQDWTMRIGWNR